MKTKSRVIQVMISGSFLILFILSSQVSKAQFTLSGEIRPRTEYLHGFGSLAQSNQEFGLFTQQRSRLNFDFTKDKYTFKLVVQDVRVWGSQSQLVANDGALTTLHESWVNIKFNKNISTKIGRQEIKYDDDRILGNVAWAQQARSHDAAVLQWKKSGLKLDFGLAYNQDGPMTTTNFYTVGKSYKAFQFIWLNKDLAKNLNASILILNNGKQGGKMEAPVTFYSQTAGARVTYKKDKFKAAVAFYSQTGEETNKDEINAMYYKADVSYDVHKKHNIGLGYEFLSGNDQLKPDSTVNRAFNPFYGTNHKFNGLMDYFYVGNHINNVGLADIYFTYTWTISEKSKLKAAFHSFSSDGDVKDPLKNEAMDKALGSEVDLVYIHKMSSDIGVVLGYSQMFATETMEALKSGDKDETNNWAWIMVTIKPTFFTTKK